MNCLDCKHLTSGVIYSDYRPRYSVGCKAARWACASPGGGLRADMDRAKTCAEFTPLRTPAFDGLVGEFI